MPAFCQHLRRTCSALPGWTMSLPGTSTLIWLDNLIPLSFECSENIASLGSGDAVLSRELSGELHSLVS